MFASDPDQLPVPTRGVRPIAVAMIGALVAAVLASVVLFHGLFPGDTEPIGSAGSGPDTPVNVSPSDVPRSDGGVEAAAESAPAADAPAVVLEPVAAPAEVGSEVEVRSTSGVTRSKPRDKAREAPGATRAQGKAKTRATSGATRAAAKARAKARAAKAEARATSRATKVAAKAKARAAARATQARAKAKARATSRAMKAQAKAGPKAPVRANKPKPGAEPRRSDALRPAR